MAHVAKTHLDKTKRAIKTEKERKEWIDAAYESSLEDFIRLQSVWEHASFATQSQRKKEVCPYVFHMSNELRKLTVNL